jgi:nucleotide-binding universal stress UspA family protein
MTHFKSILVDIDAVALAHPALDRAAELARASGARLKIVDVVTVPGDARSYHRTDLEQMVVSQRRERLTAVVAAGGMNAEVEVLKGRASVALIQEVLRGRHDLLIRSHARDLVAPKPFGTIDLQLFRQCPCPVWTVGPGATVAPRRVLAAVHATVGDPEEEALNRKIIDNALLMSRLGSGSTIVFQGWTAFAEELLRGHSSPDEAAAYVKSAEDTARQALDDLVRSFGDQLESTRIELRKGEAEDLIPSFVVSQGIDLVVMGTVARTGIAGFIIGNTAERLLRRLVCSVLAVKPDGFVTPIRLEA